MDRSSAKTNVLILRGVSIADLKRAISHVSTSPAVPDSPTPAQPETTRIVADLPRRFTSVSMWPTASNLKCWECGLVCHSYPCFIPDCPATQENQPTCDVLGCFNTWNCVIRYILREFPTSRQLDAIQAVLLFESLFNGGQKKLNIQPAPSKTQMSDYCGSKGITARQFLEKIDILNQDYSISGYRLKDLCGVSTRR